MKFSREEYIELMIFGHVGRQMFVELFGPLIGLAEEWQTQGATQEEIDMVAFDWDFVPVFGLDHRIPNGTLLENYRYYVDIGREIPGLPPRDPNKRGWRRMAF